MVKAKDPVKAGAPVAPAPVPAAPQAVPPAPVVGDGTTATKVKKEKAPKVPKEKSKKRSDFAGVAGSADPNGWIAWCDYKKGRCLAKAAKMTEAANDWERNKAGEETAKQDKKVKKLQNTLKKVAAAKAELIALGIDLKAAGLE